MNAFLNLKTGFKLALGFGLCLMLSVAIGIVSISRMVQMNDRAKLIVSDALDGTRVMAVIISDIKQYRIFEYRHVLATDPVTEADLEHKMTAKAADIEKNVVAYEATSTQVEDKANCKELVTRWKAYLSRHGEQLAISNRNDLKAGTALMLARLPVFTALTGQTTVMLDWNQKRGNFLASEAQQAYQNARSLVIAMLIVSIVLGILAATVVTRIITSNLLRVSACLTSLSDLCLTNLGHGLEALAKGDMTAKVVTGTQLLDVKSSDEFGQLSLTANTMIGRTKLAVTSFEAAQDALSKLIAQSRVATDSIAAAAAQVSAGNEDLSQRTEEQASSLEETAASMEEMTATVKQNADSARQAKQLASQAREVAEKGGQVVQNAVLTMDEVNKSSKRIADTITAIDEIAFQTNLLALNASVEAARVGEQGRGFAVVAAEVRNLAVRSATAAKEIKALVMDSVQKVEAGSNLVTQSGQQLTEIVTSVKKVADIISEISAASQEQATGIDQVNKAVMQMDQITQQNAALVEEASAASQSMNVQAQELQVVVSRFQFEPRYLTLCQEEAALRNRSQGSEKQKPTARATGTHGASAHWISAPAAKLSLSTASDDGFEEF